MADVIPHDFGKEHRETARSYARLVGILEDRAEAFIGNPSAFFADAGDRITALRLALKDAERALRPGPVQLVRDSDLIAPTMDTVVVCRDEYERLCKCAAIVRAAVNK